MLVLTVIDFIALAFYFTTVCQLSVDMGEFSELTGYCKPDLASVGCMSVEIIRSLIHSLLSLLSLIRIQGIHNVE